MRILFDHGVPRGLARILQSHTVAEAAALGWDRLNNGELLSAAESEGFDVLLTTDKNLPYQQNLAGRRIAVVVLGRTRWSVIERAAPRILAAVEAAKRGSFTLVDIPTS
jgi:predicted nuclease of predicted toxin-antitoxin system